MIREISSAAEFDSLVMNKKDVYILVKFWAEWCGPCRVLSPIIDTIDKEASLKVEFYSVNIDKSINIASLFGISAIPALVLIFNGAAVDRKLGSKTKEEIVDWLEKKVNPEK